MVEEIKIAAGFQQTEIGVFPIGWTVSPLDTISHVTSGKRLPKGNSLIDVETPYPYIRVTDMFMGGVDISGIKYVPENVFPAIRKYRIFIDDIFISVAGTLGIIGKIPKTLDGANLTENANRITNINCDRDYLMYVLMSFLIQNKIESEKTLGAQPKLALTRIRNFQIPIPSTKVEQTAIATTLSDMDALIEGLEKLLEKKCNIKQGAMQELFRPKEGWEVKNLSDVLKIKHGKSQKEVIDSNGQYPILASGGIIGRANKYLYNKPSVLIGRKGTIDVPQYMEKPFWTVDTLFFTEIFEEYNAKFIFYMFNLIDWYAYNEASGVPSLNAKTIEGIKKHFPKTLTEQVIISQILTDIDTEIVKIEIQLSKYKLMKTGMMQELLTGKKRLV